MAQEQIEAMVKDLVRPPGSVSSAGELGGAVIVPPGSQAHVGGTET